MARLTGSQLGRYRIGDLLGTGGFAAVYQAHDEGLENDVAIKVLADNHSFDPEARERFLGEGRMLRRVHHPNVLQVHDIGETEEGQPYLVLQLGDRGSVADRIAAMSDRGRQPTREDLLLLADALTAGLGALHESGIVHRDISPANLFLSGPASGQPSGADSNHDPKGPIFAADEHVIIGDLGLAKDLSAGSGFTAGAGTDRYAAPEQRVAFGEVTTVADIYSASAVLAELAQATPLAGAVADAVATGLEVDPGKRPATISDWRARLDPALAERPSAGGDRVTGTERSSVDDDGQAIGATLNGSAPRSGELVGAESRRRRAGFAVAGITAVVLAGFGVWRLGIDNNGSQAGDSPSLTGDDGSAIEMPEAGSIDESDIGAETPSDSTPAGDQERDVVALPGDGLTVYDQPELAVGWANDSWSVYDADTFDPETGTVRHDGNGAVSLSARARAVAVDESAWITMTVQDTGSAIFSLRANDEPNKVCGLGGTDFLRPTDRPGEAAITIPARLLVESDEPIFRLSLLSRDEGEYTFTFRAMAIRQNVDNPPVATNCGS